MSSGRATEETLSYLHELVAQSFIDKIKSGEATSADLSAAIKFLKDNGINCVATENDSMQEVLNNLPSHSDFAADYGQPYDPQFGADTILRTH